MKRMLLQSTAWILIRVGLVRSLLFLMQRWHVSRKDRRWEFPFIQKRRDRNFLILSYHRVSDERDPFFGGVPVGTFSRQMEVLSEYFEVLPLTELVEGLARGDNPPNGLAVTFDDGYRDIYENAFPVLKQFGMPATVFLVTGVMGSDSPIWHDRAFALFRTTEASSLLFRGETYPLGGLEQKRATLTTVLNHLRTLRPSERDSRIDRLATDLRVSEPSYARKLCWEDAREMARSGITFGAHTVSHPILTQMPLSDAVQEITDSKHAIEIELKCPVTLFAYPNGRSGDFNESIKQAVKEAGFCCAVTTNWGTNDRHTDSYELRRVAFWNEDARISALRFGWSGFWG